MDWGSVWPTHSPDSSRGLGPNLNRKHQKHQTFQETNHAKYVCPIFDVLFDLFLRNYLKKHNGEHKILRTSLGGSQGRLLERSLAVLYMLIDRALLREYLGQLRVVLEQERSVPSPILQGSRLGKTVFN